jgi:hypothetical protein
MGAQDSEYYSNVLSLSISLDVSGKIVPVAMPVQKTR